MVTPRAGVRTLNGSGAEEQAAEPRVLRPTPPRLASAGLLGPMSEGVRTERIKEAGFTEARKAIASYLLKPPAGSLAGSALGAWMADTGATAAIARNLVKLELAKCDPRKGLTILEPTVGVGQTTILILTLLRDYPGAIKIVANDVPQFLERAKANITEAVRQGAVGTRIRITENGAELNIGENRKIVFTSADMMSPELNPINGQPVPEGAFLRGSFDLVLWTNSFQMSAGRSEVFKRALELRSPQGLLTIMDMYPYDHPGSRYVGEGGMKFIAALLSISDMNGDLTEWVRNVWSMHGEIRRESVRVSLEAENLKSFGEGRQREMKCLSFSVVAVEKVNELSDLILKK
ncbi:hypothetical protein HY988_02990 [Candidatus Micrarchaeota archaeon]|nr:hypothetical protein [Candidatus Micrarchaeota archaeon]